MSLTEAENILTAPIRELSDVVESIVEPIQPVPEVDAGRLEQLEGFFAKYNNHSRASTKCYLDGRYFWKVLAPYGGLIESEMYVRINESPKTRDASVVQSITLDRTDEDTAQFDTNVLNSAELTPFTISLSFDGEHLSKTKGCSARYRLIKLVIDIADGPNTVRGVVHSNLIYIDTKKKVVTRFEPLYNAPYFLPVEQQLKAFVAENLHGYRYTTSLEHPQNMMSTRCPNQGYCAAFVLKKAMLLISHNPHRHPEKHCHDDSPSLLWTLFGDSEEKKKRHQHREFQVHTMADLETQEEKIARFADAIETEYGIIPGVPEIESGPGGVSINLGGLFGGGAYHPYSYAPVGYYNHYGYPPGTLHPVYSYGPSVIVGGVPYGRSYGHGSHRHFRHHSHRGHHSGRRGEHGHHDVDNEHGRRHHDSRHYDYGHGHSHHRGHSDYGHHGGYGGYGRGYYGGGYGYSAAGLGLGALGLGVGLGALAAQPYNTGYGYEYGNAGQSALLGALGGAALGGLLTGSSQGVLLGGLAGGAGGYLLSGHGYGYGGRHHGHHHRSHRYYH